MRPPVNGEFSCDNEECDFKTADIFDHLDHCGVEFGWHIFLNKRYSFDMFAFLESLNEMTNAGDLDAVYDHIQNATLLLVNSSDGELEEFIEESIVAEEIDGVISDIERFLKENE